MSKKKPSFEEALKQLEQVAEQIEQGKIGLEDSIAKYEEGMILVKHCRDILSRAEHRIQQLQSAPDGSLTTALFDMPEEMSQPEAG
ncbi:MAG: exodeoxyribonuclease VII small subunit [Planctomycetota bacterium]